MLFLRRFPSVIYNHRLSVSILFLVILTITYLLFYWGFVCSNLEPWTHVKNLCQQYEQGEVVGDLCSPLCLEGRITSLSCHSFHAGKEAVFSAVRDGNTRLVFKLARQPEQPTSLFWLNNGQERYPTEPEFVKMIIDHISSRLNLSVSPEQASALSRFSELFVSSPLHKTSRHHEMTELWTLLQDNEYLLVRLYASSDVFPRILGSCGQYYALEWLDHVVSGEAGWAARIKLAVLILDLLQELDNSISEGFSLCDVKPSHFGLSPSSGKLKFLDLDVALPRVVVNSITADGSTCRMDTDCSLFDCRSRCNIDSHRCDSPQTNDNLQIVCEKIFLGWTVSGSIIMPGLLMAPQTPSTLASLLRQCADPDRDGVYLAPSDHVRERLTATLQEMDKALSLDTY